MSDVITEAPSYRTDAEVEALVRAFESGELPRAAWTHRAHLTVALWYLLRFPAQEATELIRIGIQRYNQSQGIITTRENGYHETLTQFWIRMVWRSVSNVSSAHASLSDMANEVAARYSDKNLPLQYYSRERLNSWEARISWVEPDVKLFGEEQGVNGEW